MAECGRRALSLLEAARSRYESLQISDDVFGESGDDSSENPFYSTTGDSNSDSCAEASERASGAGAGGTRAPPPGSASAGHADLKEGEEEDGWNDVLQDTDTPLYKDTHGKTTDTTRTPTSPNIWLKRGGAALHTYLTLYKCLQISEDIIMSKFCISVYHGHKIAQFHKCNVIALM